MKLAPGDKLGPYEIVAPVGKGGMGEVYRAKDTRLGRDVAIKVSSREFNDRFEREAHAISALNHPNICTLHDVGPNYLVLEFIEGDTLSKLIEQGPLPLDKALTYAAQIVDALSAAHAKGIVHRDLKPGNIIVTKNGAKVLDFGLAKLTSERLPSESTAGIETVTEPITKAGSILGTLYYMAPEQVEGKEADERSDIFSFGAVFYEMVTGQRPFNGDTQAAVLAAILKDQPPPMSQRQPATPRALERLVRKCLEKKPDDRWHSARDLKPAIELIDLDAPSMTGASSSVPVQLPPSEPKSKSWLWPAITAAVVVIAAAGFFYMRPKAAPIADAVRFEIARPENANLSDRLAISPDGRRVAFLAVVPGISSTLWVRSLETLEARPLEGTAGVGGLPFWSSDSKYLTFYAQGKLKKIDASGGPAQSLADVGSQVIGGFWTADNRIVFGVLEGGGLFQVSSIGGTPTPMKMGSLPPDVSVTPSPLPNGRDFVFCYCNTGSRESGIYAASLDEGQPRKLLPDASGVIYAASPDPKLGYLLFVRGATQITNGVLMAQPIKPSTLELAGDPFPVAEQVSVTGFSASATGVLVYGTGIGVTPTSVPGIVRGQMAWFDRQGKVISTVGERGIYRVPVLSPDGKRVAIETVDAQSANIDIWLFEFGRGTNSRFTFSPKADMKPRWSRDGKSLAYVNLPAPNVFYRKSTDGAGEPEALFQAPQSQILAAWSPDERYLLYTSSVNPSDIKGVDIGSGSAADRKTFDVVTSEFNDIDPRFSPDGKWFSYTSNESGRGEIYVRPFSPPSSGTAASGGGKWMVSKNGGGPAAAWRGDGKELFFLSGDRTLMRVDVSTNPVFKAGVPEPLFKAPQGILYFDASSDGQRFLMPVPDGAGLTTPPYKVVLNWTSTIK